MTPSSARRIRGPLARLVCLALAGGCGEAPAPAPAALPTNVLLITMDTTRADALGVYGQERPTSPSIDRLAGEGVRVEEVYTAAPSTLPAHTTILTGQLPFSHGVRSNAGYQLSPELTTLAEVFAAHGYATAAEVAAPVIGRRTGIDQGFESFREPDSPDAVRKTLMVRGEDGQPQPLELREREAGDITRRGIEFLRSRGDAPFFLWLHYFDPHQFYVPPSPWVLRFPDSPYHAEVFYADDQIGRVLDTLGRIGIAERTLVVLTADHGEALGEHGEPTHTYFVYDSTMRVPLIFSLPGVLPAGGRIQGPVRSADIAPTILELVGLPPLSGIQGVSLAASLRAGTEPPALDAYGESLEPNALFGSSALRFLRSGRWKYIHKLEPELYDVRADPGEHENRAAQEPDTVARLAERLAGWVRRDLAHHDDAHLVLSREAMEQLVALGYAGVAPSPDFDDAQDVASPRGPDPNAKLEDAKLYAAGWTLMLRKEYAEAHETFHEVYARNPEGIAIIRALVNAGIAAGERVRNIPVLRKAIEIDPQRLEFYGHLAEALTERGDLAEAEQVLRVGLRIDPCDLGLRLLLATHLHATGRAPEQLETLREGMDACPTTADFQNDYAYLRATSRRPALRDPAEALRIASEIVEASDGQRPDYLDTLACAHAASGDFRRAEDLTTRALTLLEGQGASEETRAPYETHRALFARDQPVVE